MIAIGGDLATLRASWQTMRGGWAAAQRDAQALIVQRRVFVETPPMAGGQAVLRTRLRLIGDTQTDILRPWFEKAAATDLENTTQAHFKSVAAAMEGWNVVRAMESLVVQLTRIAGIGIGAIATVVQLAQTPLPLMLHAVLGNFTLWGGLGFALLGDAVRWGLRWRLRALFRRNLA